MAQNPNPSSKHPRQPAAVAVPRQPAAHAHPRPWAVAAWCAAALLAACGGGGAPPEAPAAVPVQADSGLESRRFILWEPGREADVRAEQAALAADPGADDVRLVVRMNPAAVAPGGRAALLGAGQGEGGDAAAQQARQLAAKAAAVAAAAEDVMTRSVRAVAPSAELGPQFAHAIEGFVVVVPFSQAQAVADRLARDPAIDAVEPDRRVVLEQAVPVRALDGRAWGVDRIDQRARSFDAAFRSSRTGQGVTVHVVDTGISPHSQFGTRLRAGFSAINDGHGTRDCHGHGTHVAGTAAGSTLGVAPAAAIVPVRVMDCRGGGSGTALLAGLDWIAAHGARPGVVNMSLGGSAFAALDAAAQRLAASGFTVVAAAGNSNVDACTQSPARASGLITVAASDYADAKAAFSNTGACVALWAPGTQIASAGIASGTAVVGMSGTSMAAPHAAGAAALLLQGQPTATAAQVRERMLQDATPNLVLGVGGPTTRALLHAGDTGAPPLPANRIVRPVDISFSTAVPAVGLWSATATVRVVDTQGVAVAGARVAGRFSHMTAELACTTAADGRCTLASGPAAWGTTTVIRFALTSLGGAQLADAGTGTRSAQVAQPAAPVASVTALSGTMQRPSAQSTQWAPRFAITLSDAQRAGVAGATVQAQIRVHAGAGVVGVANLACQTAANGRCQVSWPGPLLGSTQTGAVLEVKGVSRSFLVYKPGALTQASVGVVR